MIYKKYTEMLLCQYMDLEISTLLSVCKLNKILVPFNSWTIFGGIFEIWVKFLTKLLILDGQKNDILDSIFVQALGICPSKLATYCN